MEPQWKHDCTECQFLGRYGETDVYIHTRGTIVEVVIRYSDNGPDYWSGSVIKKEASMAPCGICTEVKEIRYIDLYIIGSEGLNICHECEMRLVGYIRDMKSLVATAKMMGVKIGRRE